MFNRSGETSPENVKNRDILLKLTGLEWRNMRYTDTGATYYAATVSIEEARHSFVNVLNERIFGDDALFFNCGPKSTIRIDKEDMEKKPIRKDIDIASLHKQLQDVLRKSNEEVGRAKNNSLSNLKL
jgi:hypothetical protein